MLVQAASASEGLIFLDPGHGGDDRGAVSEYGTEAQFVLETALLLEKALLDQGRVVGLTRRKDQNISAGDRMARAAKAELILSLHLANHGIDPGGPIIYYSLRPPGQDEKLGLFSLWTTPPATLSLAQDLAFRLAELAGLNPQRVREFPLTPWLEGAPGPALMIEVENLEWTTVGGGEMTPQDTANYWAEALGSLWSSETE